MKKVWKRRFLKALRTPMDEGGYLQTQGRLCGIPKKTRAQDKQVKEFPDAEGFCCIGVLGDVAVQHGLATWRGRSLASHGRASVASVTSLPTMLMVDMGLTSDAQERLISMNDVRGYSFSTIANWVEKNL